MQFSKRMKSQNRINEKDVITIYLRKLSVMCRFIQRELNYKVKKRKEKSHCVDINRKT